MNFEKRSPHLRLKLQGWRSRFVLFAVAAALLIAIGLTVRRSAADRI